MLKFSFEQISFLCRELQEKKSSFHILDVFSIGLSEFIFLLGDEERKEKLYFSFKPPFIRFHLVQTGKKQKKGEVHPLSKYLDGATLIRSEAVNQDRIVQLTFQKDSQNLTFIGEFFSKHPNCYLLNSSGVILWSLHPVKQTHYSPPIRLAPFSPSSLPPLSSIELEKMYEKLLFEKKIEENQKLLDKERKKFQKKEEVLKKSLKEALEWNITAHQGDLIKAHFGEFSGNKKKVLVTDWETGTEVELVIPSLKTPQEEMERLFKKAKKMKLSIPHLQSQLAKINNKIEALTLLDPFSFVQESKKEPMNELKKETSKIYREFISLAGLKILVGKSDRTNDKLTFEYANGNDWWFHVKDCSGSHVILKNPKPDEESLKDAMQLALYYSKARLEKGGEVCWTQRKYLSRMKNSRAGKVQISKHHTTWVTNNPEHVLKLKNRGINHDENKSC